MLVSDFDFELPPDLIALRPAEPRSTARLLVLRTDESILDRRIADLPSMLRRGDLLVINDTKVIRARLTGMRGAARIETTLHRRLGGARWAVFAKPAKRLRVGDRVVFGDDFEATVESKVEAGEIILRFDLADTDLDRALVRFGRMPLPPYISGKRTPDERDASDYQTVFAEREGAVAAPTAGLHFSPELLAHLGEAGIGVANLTLHVGAGTFLPVRSETTEGHRMHAEWGEIGAATAAEIARTKAAGGRIVAVGTTSARLLETAASDSGDVRAWAGETDIFIVPGYRFRAVDMLITNFHLPRSTLMMLVAAFAGLDRIKTAYAHAIRHGYRFYSYGDACLIEGRQI